MTEHASPAGVRSLSAGLLTTTFDDGTLRWITWDGAEIVRGIYVAVRDRAWRTIKGDLHELDIQSTSTSFDVRFLDRHSEGPIDFRWAGRISGDQDGSIVFEMDGIAASTFDRNRIGICILHPMQQAGTPVRVTTPSGTIESAFPERTSSVDPFTDIMAMSFPISATVLATIQLDGDMFEMEDQRNWTDASYKTFSTPHRLPIPVTIEQGTRIRQSVSLRIEDTSTDSALPARSRRKQPSTAVIQVSDVVLGSRPAIGTSLAPGREILADVAKSALATLRPDSLRVVLDLDRQGWRERLAPAIDLAGAIGGRLEIEAIVSEGGGGLEDLVTGLATSGSPSPDVYVFAATGHVTTLPLAVQLRAAAEKANVAMRVGGGSRANFAEFNRADLPNALLDVVGYPISPQVHAFDDASLFETIDAQAVTLRDAMHIVGSTPLAIGPITLLPRFNPYTGARPLFDVGTERERRDPRQGAWLAAAWTLASLVSLANAGAQAVSYHEVVGPAGILDERGQMLPVGGVIGDVLGGPGTMLRVAGPADLAILALGHSNVDARRVLVANLRDRPRSVAIDTPTPPWAIVTVSDAGGPPVERSGRARQVVEIRPYGVVRLDIGVRSRSG